MAPRTKKNILDKEPIENLKDLIGFKWSTIIGWLIGFIPTAAISGFIVGQWVANTNKKEEIYQINLKHQKEVYQAIEGAKKETVAEYKAKNSEAQYIVEIIREVRKK